MIACRAASIAKCSGVFSVRKTSSGIRPPPPEVPFDEVFSSRRQNKHTHACQWLRIFGERPIGADNENVPILVGVARPHFFDPRIECTRSLIRPHHEIDLGRDLGVHRRQRHRIEIVPPVRLQIHDRSLGRAARDQRRRPRRMQNPRRREVVGVGITRPLAADDAHAATGTYALRRRLHHRLIHTQRGRGQVLEVEIGVIATRRQSRRQVLLYIVLVQSVFFEEEALIRRTHYAHNWLDVPPNPNESRRPSLRRLFHRYSVERSVASVPPALNVYSCS